MNTCSHRIVHIFYKFTANFLQLLHIYGQDRVKSELISHFKSKIEYRNSLKFIFVTFYSFEESYMWQLQDSHIWTPYNQHWFTCTLWYAVYKNNITGNFTSFNGKSELNYLLWTICIHMMLVIFFTQIFSHECTLNYYCQL